MEKQQTRERGAGESFKKRLAALDRHVAKTGEVLTEAQLRPGKEAERRCGSRDRNTAHPDYLGSQDGF